jgi:hypothetical protein
MSHLYKALYRPKRQLIRWPYFLCMMCLFGSCITDRKLERAYQASRYFDGYPARTSIDGIYSNKSRDTLLDRSLYAYLTESSAFGKAYEKEPPVDRIRLQYDGSRRLTVSFMDSGKRTRPYRLRIKDKGRYISVHRQTFFLPIPGFVMYTGYKMILVNDMKNSLVAVSGRGTFAELFVFIPAWRTFYYTSAFEKR